MKRRSLLRALPLVAMSGCTAPNADTRRVTERTLEDTGQCSNPESASVDISGSRVRVMGCVTGPNGCSVASLESATLDGDTLSIVVTTASDAPPGTACTQALVYRGYTATVTLDGGQPAAVRVVHDVPGGRETVVEA